MQTKKWSLIEIISGLIFGLVISIFITQPIVFGWYDVDFGVGGNTMIAVIFTIISLFRSYFVRRFFNWIHIKYPHTYGVHPQDPQDKKD